jgi:LytS/YehU family sensor histidine kinase
MQRELHAAQLRLLRAQLKPQLVLDLVRDARDRLRRGAANGDAQLDRLIDYLQGALPRLDAQRTTLGEELELANGYLSLISEQSASAISWQTDIPDETLATPCPPRLLVVLVELAARLGLGLPDGGGRIDLWARMARGRCVVRVGDSGPLGDARHEALDALRRRLLLAEGESIRLQCWQRETGGSVVEVDFPCIAPT